MNFLYSSKTKIGRRKSNEDNLLSFVNDEGVLIVAIADGMGGHKGGEIASSLVIKYIKRIFKSINLKNLPDEEVQKRIILSIRTIQKKLISLAEKDERLIDMGTTLNMNVFLDSKMYTLNIGDSRTSQFTKKEIKRITEDHNLATLALKSPSLSKYKNYTNYLTSSLGPNKESKVDMFITTLNKWGYIIMTSDGVHNFVNSSEFIKILKPKNKALEDKTNSIIKLAYENNSNDNMTIILVRYDN